MNPAVKPALVNAAGHVIGQTGKATFNAHLKAGLNDRALIGEGLTNPTGADIHLVIKDHGPPVPGLVKDQTSTLGGGCTTSFIPDGQPGDYECMDLQFAVFEQ